VNRDGVARCETAGAGQGGRERMWRPSMNTRTIAIAALVIAVIILLFFLF
jgi:hypothetical protein